MYPKSHCKLLCGQNYTYWFKQIIELVSTRVWLANSMSSDAGGNSKCLKPYDQCIKIGSGRDCVWQTGSACLLRAFKLKKQSK